MLATKTRTQQNLPSNMENQKYTAAHGRRKGAAARVRLFKGKGLNTINDKTPEDYFLLPSFKAQWQKFMNLAKAEGQYYATIKVSGSGKSSQFDAVIHGFANALVKEDKEKNRSTLKKAGYLTRDPRVRERRKAGNAQKARKGKQSPKR